MMNALDGIDYISFGAECDDIDLLQKIAELTVNEPPQVSEFIKKSVSSGISYGSARAAAISEYLQNQNLTGYTSADLDRILASPNNILAIEYIATLIQTDSRIKTVPIRRILSEYNSTATDNDICSASAIRELLRSSDVESLRRHIPDSCYNILQNAYRKSFPMFDDDLSHLLSARRILAPCTDDIVDMDRDRSSSNIGNDFLYAFCRML
jgi:predicted nucleotidyltransferase